MSDLIYHHIIEIQDQLNRIEQKLDERPIRKYLSISEASYFTSLSTSTLRRAVARGGVEVQ